MSRPIHQSPPLRTALLAFSTALALLVGAGSASSQDRPPSPSFRGDPGFVDFEALGLVEADEVELRVSLYGPILQLVAEATREDEPGFSELLDKLRAIRADLYEVASDRRPTLRRRTTEVARLLERRGWQTVVEVRSESGDLSFIQTRSDGESISGLSVMFVEPGGSAGFINIVGDVSPRELGRLGRTFRIEALERLDTELEDDTSADEPEEKQR